MTGQLFTQYFLTDGIKSTGDWNATFAHPDAFNGFRDGARCLLASFTHFQDPNEATTEQELIRPLLELLGWADYLPQQGATRNEDIPDLLLFADADAKAHAAARTNSDDRFLDAAVVAESKRRGRPLDARETSGRTRTGTPHGQILRYLRRAADVTDGGLRWGILTDGGVWRLYDQRARPRATGYFEADLAELIADDADDLRTFYLLFRRRSFALRPGATATFLETALAEGQRYEQQVAQDLSSMVFERAFPNLVQALLHAGGADLAEVRQAALILLYRLLFVLYAEDRGLLPVNDSRYDDYGLRKRVRDDIARRMDAGDTFSSRAGNYYDRVMTLAGLIDTGDDSIGLPPYNGGLFASDAAPLLVAVHLPDAAFAPIVYDLSHAEIDGQRQFVNYRDMTVQQLGSLYERLLEREPVCDGQGRIAIRPNPYARKDSGSFYTPQELVDLILDQTLKPLAEERLEAFEDKSRELAGDRRPKADRKAELERLDPAEAVLELKVLDPAMGSGHFLVAAVDFLADYIADLIEYVPAVPEWLDGDDAYESPLVERVAAIRRDIVQRAEESNWVMDEAQLSDRTIIRRMVLKRCIYGVDKNPLTVELAKVSLWLHSFTVGAPLSFLDHHLRSGDSLLGLRVLDARKDFDRLGGLSASSVIAGAEAATDGMQRIERLSDADVAEVRQSAGLFEDVEQATADLRGVLDFLCGLRWQTAGLNKRARARVEGPVVEALGRELSIAFDLLARGPEAANETMAQDDIWREFTDCWTQARFIADREEFLHWEVAFPGVWRHWQSFRPEGGFDAVIGNPPWDRIKLQEVEWLAMRDPELARAPTAAARRQGIESLRQKNDPLAADFDAAKEQSEKLSLMIRASGQYPLLGRGDINMYALFVERAIDLINPQGLVCLLTPSGIYADKTTAEFFKTVSTSGRVGGIFDFENRRVFFQDIHASQKFCALIVGGSARTFPHTKCAFFLHNVDSVYDDKYCFILTPDDFSRVNPNTGTAPVFRTRRDAEITRGIYERHPVLVDRSNGEERRAWPVKYMRMFDMTNDSELFRTTTQLEKEGFYPVLGNRWKRGDETFLPLYEGKMVQGYDHRAASVVVNPENLHRPAQPRETTLSEHMDSSWLPGPQFWVSEESIKWLKGLVGVIAFKDATATTNSRSMIAAIIPRSGVGNTLPLLMPQCESARDYHSTACLWVACLNSLAYDFIARQKIQGQHLNLYIIEQIPVLTAARYELRFGDRTAAELVQNHVLQLTYTADDMEPFARDLGYAGPPFTWNEEDRCHLRARLDALHFHLYGLDREDAGYVLDTFPIVRKEDEDQFDGRYRTKELILAYMNALAAGDTKTVVAI